MAILPIMIYPAPVLKQVARPVAHITEATRRLLDDLTATMYDAPGVGLAAPQVNVGQRVIVVDVGEPVPLTREEYAQREESRARLYQLVNPAITAHDGEIVWEEGCLSLPGLQVEVRRAAHVVVEALDRNGAPVVIDAHGLLAVALQHEIDHLNGKLLVDRLSRLKRALYREKLEKEAEE